jgi:hypothetical protein
MARNVPFALHIRIPVTRRSADAAEKSEAVAGRPLLQRSAVTTAVKKMILMRLTFPSGSARAGWDADCEMVSQTLRGALRGCELGQYLYKHFVW